MRAFVDRIENGIATLLLGDDEAGRAEFPVQFLPQGTHEGMILQLTIAIDRAATHHAHEAVQELLDRLRGDEE